MVTLGDSSHSEGRQSFVGDMLCLLSSLLYASYTIAIRQMLPNDEHADVITFFGFIGLLNLVFMAPVLIILWLMSVVQLQGMTAWLLLLAVCKGVHSFAAVTSHLVTFYLCHAGFFSMLAL